MLGIRRETFIALRASRQAHRIASDFLNPSLNVPEFSLTPITTDELNERRARKETRSVPLLPKTTADIVICVLLIVGIIALIALDIRLFLK